MNKHPELANDRTLCAMVVCKRIHPATSLDVRYAQVETYVPISRTAVADLAWRCDVTASCYLCLQGHTHPIPNTSVGDAEGACKTCGILACAGHGYRDGSVPAYYCVLCKVAILAVAGATASTGSGPSNIAPEISPLLPSGGAGIYAAAQSIRSPYDEFQGPGVERYWSWVLDDAQMFASMPAKALAGSTIEHWWAGIPSEGRLLIGCALAIVERLDLPREQLIPLLQMLMTGVARA